MARTTYKPHMNVLFLFSSFLLGALLAVEGFAIHSGPSQIEAVSSELKQVNREHSFQKKGDEEWKELENKRRMMIGSTMPTCTYNECRGCKYKCRAEQIPVDGNDPINSAYHYKCVCHRSK